MRASWRLLAARRDLRLVLSAGLVSRTGDWVLLIGLLYRVYAMTSSTVASALTVLCATVPAVALGPVAGMFADRWDRKHSMIAADLLLAAGLLPLLAVRGPGQVPIVYAVVFFEACVEQFFNPAQQAIIPHLVSDEELMAANALGGGVRDISRLAGSALGGLIAAAGGLAAVTLADAASFAVSAALLALVRTRGTPAPLAPARAGRDTLPQRLAGLGRELREGLHLATRHRLLRALMIFVLVTSVGEGIMTTLATPFVEQVLHGTSQQYGLFAAAQAIGGITGGLAAVPLSQRVPAWRLLGCSAAAFGAIDLAIFLYPLAYPAFWPAIAGMILVGLPGALAIAAMTTLFQTSTDDTHRGRIFGALSAIEGIAILTGTLTAGYLARPLGIIPVIAVQGAGYLIAGLAMTGWMRHQTQPEPVNGVPDASTVAAQ